MPRGSFVSRIIRLALLAPDIVDVILEGKQPAYLTLRDLMGPFPVEWNGQREMLINCEDRWSKSVFGIVCQCRRLVGDAAVG